jgi:NitT/TauT family transport system substrate-binding protein
MLFKKGASIMKKLVQILIASVILVVPLVGYSANSDETQTSSTIAGKTQDDYKIKVGVIKALGTVTPYVSQNLNLFSQKGINVEFIDFADGTTVGEAFAAGGLDIGYLGVAPAATWQMRGVDFKIVASSNGGGHVILTRNDTGINTVADLKDKKIAAPSAGTVTDTLLRDYILPQAGIDPKKDLTIVAPVKPADMAVALLVNKEVDAIMTWEPFASQAENTYDDVKVLYDSPNVIKRKTGEDAFYSVNVVIASQNLIDNHKELLQEFLNINAETVNYLNNDSGANEIISKILQLDVKIVEDARRRVDYTYKLNIENLERTLAWAKNLGYLGVIPARAELFDTSFVNSK